MRRLMLAALFASVVGCGGSHERPRITPAMLMQEAREKSVRLLKEAHAFEKQGNLVSAIACADTAMAEAEDYPASDFSKEAVAESERLKDLRNAQQNH